MISAAGIYDGLRNLVTGLGTARDKSAASEFYYVPLNRSQIIGAYRSSWLPRKIVNIPADDATRKWRSWSADKDQITKIEEVETALQLQSKINRAFRLARLLGGAAIYIGTTDNDVTKPIDVERIGIGGLKYLSILSQDKISPTEIDRDPASEYFGTPLAYNLTLSTAGMVSNVHPSRLVVLHGEELPDLEIFASTGFGDPVLQSVYEALMQHGGTTANIAALVFESKIDVISIPGLMKNIGNKGYEKQVIERFGLASFLKGNNNTTLLDANELHTQKTMSFSALPDVLDRFSQNVSGAADIPMTRLFGQSPGGMNSTGDSDLKNYYDNIQSLQENQLDGAMRVLNELIIRSALGTRPPEITYGWRSLWQTTETQRADILAKATESIKKLSDTKMFPEETLTTAATNFLIELDVMPGLEAAVEEFGLVKDTAELDREALAAASNALADPNAGQANDPAAKHAPKTPIKDAAPRSMYVYRKVTNAAAVAAWARSQGFDEVDEADLHVTIAYSREAVDWIKMGESYESKVEIDGGPRVVERLGAYTVLMFASSAVQYRHNDMKRRGATWDYPDYQPHISITKSAKDVDLSKVKPYIGKIILGPELFEEVKP